MGQNIERQITYTLESYAWVRTSRILCTFYHILLDTHPFEICVFKALLGLPYQLCLRGHSVGASYGKGKGGLVGIRFGAREVCRYQIGQGDQFS